MNMKTWRGALLRIVLVAMVGLSISACAHRPPAGDPAALAEYKRINDPLEPMNRATHSFNMGFDRVFMKPLAQIYRAVFPRPIRHGITNVLNNLREPWTLLNDVLQGQVSRGGETIARFAINSTVGIGGILDPATGWGIKNHKEDIGQTLAVWGVGEGFYLEVPFFGPSNPRDFFGTVVEFFGDPVDIILDNHNLKEVHYTRTALRIIDFRQQNLETLDDLKRNSTDYYATLRSAYRQKRAFEISNGKSKESKNEEDLFDTEMDDN